MIRHLLKLTWNRKKKHGLLVVEFFLTFIVLFSIMIFVYTGIGNTLKPLGFEYKKTMLFSIPIEDTVKSNVDLKIDQIKKQILNLKDVEGVSIFTSPLPFTKNTGKEANVKYSGLVRKVFRWGVDKDFQKVMSISIQSGRWFLGEDKLATVKPVVINNYLKEHFFKNEDPLGKIITIDEEKRRVIGVVDKFRTTSRTGALEGFFELDYDNGPWFNSLVKFNNPIAISSYEQLRLIAQPYIKGKRAKFWEVQTINHFRDMESAQYAIPVVLMSIVCGFLILNVVLGLFSILWQNINRRKMEIGLRRAVGAFAAQIYRQIILETVLLVTIALIPAAVIAVQLAAFKAFNTTPWEYFISYILSAVLIYLVVIVCALYPSKLAASIQPAAALHEE